MVGAHKLCCAQAQVTLALSNQMECIIGYPQHGHQMRPLTKVTCTAALQEPAADANLVDEATEETVEPSV